MLADALVEDDLVREHPAVVEVLAAEPSLNLRVQAALALGWFMDASGALAELGRTIADPNVPLDLRYAAFTSSWFSVPGGIAGHPAPGSVVDAVAADVILVGRPQDEARVPITSRNEGRMSSLPVVAAGWERAGRSASH